MKVKTDFVTNSSSTAYIINVKGPQLTAEQMVSKLFGDSAFLDDYKSYHFDADEYKSVSKIIDSLNGSYDFPLGSGEHVVEFGDEHGTPAGYVFDYCLRDGFSFDEFDVTFFESRR